MGEGFLELPVKLLSGKPEDLRTKINGVKNKTLTEKKPQKKKKRRRGRIETWEYSEGNSF